MEEEKKDWVEKFSKDELIEDIQREFATDARNNTGCGSILLILLVYCLFSALSTGDWSSDLWSMPAILLPPLVIDIWWKKRMSKCEDTHQLVNMYDKYNKAKKIFSYIVAIVLVLYICYDIYSDFGKESVAITLISIAIAGIVIGLLTWALFRKRDKMPVEKEMDSLRDMISEEQQPDN